MLAWVLAGPVVLGWLVLGGFFGVMLGVVLVGSTASAGGFFGFGGSVLAPGFFVLTHYAHGSQHDKKPRLTV